MVPLLVTQGRADTIVLPAMAEHVLATCPTAEPSWYQGVGHTPHLEQPERFNHELADLTRRTLRLIIRRRGHDDPAPASAQPPRTTSALRAACTAWVGPLAGRRPRQRAGPASGGATITGQLPQHR
jgi:hypothetical protein